MKTLLTLVTFALIGAIHLHTADGQTRSKAVRFGRAFSKLFVFRTRHNSNYRMQSYMFW